LQKRNFDMSKVLETGSQNIEFSGSDVAIVMATNKRTLVSIALLVAVFGCNFSYRAFSIALPHIIANWNAMQLYTIGTSLMTVAMTVTTIAAARISPRIGLKITVSFGLILILICNMLILFAPNMLIFVLLRIVTGVGNGLVSGQMAASFNKIWPGAKRGTWIGILGVCQSFSNVIGPTTAGILVDAYGWRSTYYAVSLIQLIGLIMFVVATPKDTTDRFYKPVRFDSFGALAFTVVITALVLVGSFGNSLGWGSPIIIGGFALAGIAFISMVKRENKMGSAALLPWDLFKKDRNFQKIFALTFFITILACGQTYYMPLYLQKVAGTTATISALPFTILSITSLIGSAIAGRIFKKTGKSKPLIIASASLMFFPVLFYGIWLSPTAGSQTGILIMSIVSSLYGFGYILTITIPYYACSEYLSLESVGIGSANIYMGVTVGASMGMSVLQAVMNGVSAIYNLNIALKVVYLCCSASGVIALLFGISLGKIKKEQKVL
jgi:MFS family permease